VSEPAFVEAEMGYVCTASGGQELGRQSWAKREGVVFLAVRQQCPIKWKSIDNEARKARVV
jgi:hypothetical protein